MYTQVVFVCLSIQLQPPPRCSKPLSCETTFLLSPFISYCSLIMSVLLGRHILLPASEKCFNTSFSLDSRFWQTSRSLPWRIKTPNSGWKGHQITRVALPFRIESWLFCLVVPRELFSYLLGQHSLLTVKQYLTFPCFIAHFIKFILQPCSQIDNPLNS